MKNTMTISAKQVADTKATMQFIENCANNNQIPAEEWNAAVDRYNAAKAIVAASEITAEQIGLTINTALNNGRIVRIKFLRGKYKNREGYTYRKFVAIRN